MSRTYLARRELESEFIIIVIYIGAAEKDWEAELKKASKPKAGKRKQTKLDKDGNRPEVSVYAKIYNKVKAQFTRMRYVILAPRIAPCQV